MLSTLLAAAQPLLQPAFVLFGAPVTWLEIVAFVLALLMVWANLHVKTVAWPLAIASSLLYALLFADSRLYGESGLQIAFVIVSLWGWWQWLRGTAGSSPLVVRHMGMRARALALAATLVAWPLLGLLLARMTDSDVPYFDALATAASLTGQVLLARKYVENWPVWLMVNLISVALFVHKGLWLTVLLYALFALLSVAGWRAWQRLAVRGGLR
ncbi:MAG: nicotinamide riboside transporter PnuC [Rubrivivax sp.]|nr:nicotinamide riboside transporter PnuC [Rubrivivax sp.]